jgi:hypothetical protein
MDGKYGILAASKWRTEPEITPGLYPGDRVVRTKEELEAALREPNGVSPSRTLWIHEDLEDAIRRRWKA